MTTAEQRGYSRGYIAGRKRLETDIQAEIKYANKQDLLDQIYLEFLPIAMQCQGWQINDKPVSTTSERVSLARAWALEAMKQRPYAT